MLYDIFVVKNNYITSFVNEEFLDMRQIKMQNMSVWANGCHISTRAAESIETAD